MGTFNKSLWVGLLATLGITAALIPQLLNYPTIPPEISLVSALKESTSWHPTLLTFDNSYISYREDPLLISIIGLCTDSSSIVFLVKLFVFTAGMMLFLSAFGGALIAAPLASLALIAFAGESQVLLTHVLWLPWLGWTLITPRLSRTVAILGILFFSMRLYHCCGERTLLISGFVWILCTNKIYRKSYLTALFVFLPAILAFWTAPLPCIPNYPADARLVPDDTLPEALLPFFSSSTSTPSINRINIKTALHDATIFIFVLSGLFAAFHRSRTALITFLLSLTLFLDIIPSEGTAQLFPFAVFSRIYPSLYLYSAIPLLVSFIVIASASSRKGLLLTTLLAALFCYDASLRHHTMYTLGAERHASFERAWNIKALDKALASPSFYSLYHHHFSMPLVEGHDYTKLRLWDIPHTLHASHTQEDIKFVADDNGSTRWSPKVGVQDGKGWILLKFSEKKIPTLRGLQVDSGVFFSDFARGIRIKAAERCNSKSDGAFTTLTEYPNWEGSLGTTRRKGLPYFEYRYLGKLYFSRPTIAQCYLIESIGNNSQYDWSVASLILFEAIADKKPN